MQIPYISPLKTLCYMYLGILVLVLNVSNAPPLGQQTADKSPRNPPPYPVLGVVGRDNDRRINNEFCLCCLFQRLVFSERREKLVTDRVTDRRTDSTITVCLLAPPRHNKILFSEATALCYSIECSTLV